MVKLHRPLLLATASEARRSLVKSLGINFTPCSVDIDESVLPGESLTVFVERLAKAKVLAVHLPSPEAIVIAADTAIGFEGEIMGKADDELAARSMLERFSENTHLVATAIAIRDDLHAKINVETTITEICMSKLTPEMIAWYLSTGEWRGKAGAYGIQEKGAALVAEIRGCLTNVIGISLSSLLNMLARVR